MANVTVLDNGLIPIEGKPDYAINLQEGSEYYEWIFVNLFGKWSPQRKLQYFEISQVKDQKFYGEEIGRGLKID